MIETVPLPLSSLEGNKIRAWFILDEGLRLIELVNADIIRLQVELSNTAVESGTYPNQHSEAEDKLKQIMALKNFLEILDRYAKMKEYSLVRLEPKYERST